MSSSIIHNYESFTAERDRLRVLFLQQRQLIVADIESLKEEIQPVAEVINVAKILTRRDHSLGFLSKGIDFAVDILVKKVFFRKAGFLTRMLVAFLAKNVVSQFAGHKIKEEFPGLSKVVNNV